MYLLSGGDVILARGGVGALQRVHGGLQLGQQRVAHHVLGSSDHCVVWGDVWDKCKSG